MTRDVVTVEVSSRSNGDSNLTCGEDPSFWFNWLFGSLLVPFGEFGSVWQKL
jgi:hypothetical protein